MHTEIIKIDFKCYHTLKFGIWVDWCKSEMNGIDYFLKGNKITKDTNPLVDAWLGFLKFPYKEGNYDLIFDNEHIDQKTLKQKIDAIVVLKKDKNIFEYLPKITSIFSQKEISKVLDLPFDVAFEQSIFYLKCLMETENKLQNSLKKYVPTNDEIMAGYNDLEFWANYGMYDSLANGDILKHNEVLNLSVSEAHTKIIYQNHIQHYQRNLQNIIYKNQQRK